MGSSLVMVNMNMTSLSGEGNDSHDTFQLHDGGQEQVPITFPRAATLAAAVCAIIFIIVGVTGNLITILALYNSRKLRTHATTWFVLSLCFSDLIFCVINLPLTASRYIHEAWIHGDTLCRLFPFFFYGNMACSLMSMVAITVNRYVLISHYTLYDRLYRNRNIVLMIILVWTFSFAMLLPPLLEIWGRLGLDDPPSFSCTILKKNGKSPKKFLFIFGILIPCLLIICCYSSIFFRVRKNRLRLDQSRNDGLGDGNSQKPSFATASQKRLRRNDVQLTKMMLLIFCCFIICFLPLMILNVLDHDMQAVSPTIHICGSILAWSSSCINLIIYVLTNRQYRQAYAEFLCRRGPTDRSYTASGSVVKTEMIQLNVATDKIKINNKTNNGINHNHDLGT